MAYLELVCEGDPPRCLVLDRKPVIIGREPSCDVVTVDAGVSRQHAAIRPTDHNWRIEDLGSKNGTLLNGSRTAGESLRDGDVVGVGSLTLRFLAGAPKEPRRTCIEPAALHAMVTQPQVAAEGQRRSELLLEIAMALDHLDTPDRVLATFGELLVRLFAPSFALLQVGDERFCAGHGSTEEAAADGAGSPLSETVLRSVTESGEAQLLTDVPATANVGGAQSARACGIISAMGAPILSGGQRVGAVYVDRRDPLDPPLCRDDLVHLVLVGRLIGSAMVGSRRMARLSAENRLLRADDAQRNGPIVGRSQALTQLRALIEDRVGPARSTVLLTGETGVGKTRVARAIHLASPCRNGPFVCVNCAAIPRDLLESELFGHEKGSFSGAHQRKRGQFETASSGTLFLDEVGELDMGAQAKLLTAIEERQIRRVGGLEPIPIDVRVIAATHHDLAQEAQQGRFRADLYYRLGVICVEVPPLRDRPDDIEPLALHFLQTACSQVGRRVPGMTAAALGALQRHPWPGNVRELANCMERAVVFADEDAPLDATHLPDTVLQAPVPTSCPRVEGAMGEKERVVEALAQAGGNKRQAARLLGWYPQKLYDRLRRYDICTTWS